MDVLKFFAVGVDPAECDDLRCWARLCSMLNNSRVNWSPRPQEQRGNSGGGRLKRREKRTEASQLGPDMFILTAATNGFTTTSRVFSWRNAGSYTFEVNFFGCT
jgi:hypothetical protein